ncbi:MAG TPA: glycosyltransferase family 4 protein [bacterium]|nr:glycosyltransferase family 4 protein [bacterium]
MKIALISARADPYIPPVDVHGGTVVMLNLINSLSRLGHQVDIFTRLDKDADTESTERRFRAKRQTEEGGSEVQIDKNIRIFRIPYESSGKETNVWDKQLNESATFLNAIEDHLFNGNYDVIHYFHLASISGWYKKYDTPPFLKKSTFSPLFLAAGRKFEILPEEKILAERKVLNDIPIISSQSVGEAKKIIKHHNISKDKISITPLGVDLSIFYPKKDFYSVLQREVILITSPNNIKPQKKQLEVVKVIGELKKKGVPVKGIFVGNIGDQFYLKSILDLLANNSLTYTNYEGHFSTESFIFNEFDILFIPSQREKVLADIIRACDIAIFPSTDEGFSLLNLNCLACGTVPICTNSSEYSSYLLPNKNSIAVDTIQPWEKFAEQAYRLCKNKEKIVELSLNASNSASQFTWDEFVENQVKVYEDLCR